MEPNQKQENLDANEAGDLAGQLAEANERIARLSHELDDLQLEKSLTCRLVAAGAVDLEAAVLLARGRMEDQPPEQIDDCIAQLRRDKAYLFANSPESSVSRKTTGAKDRLAPGPTGLERAATKAAKSGSRADLLTYLKLRRHPV